MAKRIEDIVTIPAQTGNVVYFPTADHIKPCGCGDKDCESVIIGEQRFLYSNVTGQYYNDGACLCKGVEEDIDFTDKWERIRFYTKWQVEDVG